MKFLNFIFIIIFALSTNIGYAAKITDDTLTVAKPGSSANKELKLGTKVIRSNESTGKLEFSNDGTLYKNLGSGSGSGDAGVSVLENASFEDGLTPGWASVGGTFTQETYTNGIEGDTKYARHVATTSGQYFESTAKVVTDNIGTGCLAYAKYKTSDSNAYKISFISAGTEISFEQLVTTGGAWANTPFLPVLCPAAGTLIKIRFESLAAGTLEVDKAYLGSENRTVQTSSPRLVAKVIFPTNACTQQRTTAGFGPFPTNATCAAPTVQYYNQGGVVIGTSDQDSHTKFTIVSMPKGILEIKGRGTGDSGTGNEYQWLRFNDGTSTGEEQTYYNATNGAWHWPVVSFKKAYPNGASNLTIELEGQRSTASTTIISSQQAPQYDLYLWPLSTDSAVSARSSAFEIEAYIRGVGADQSLGITGSADNQVIFNSSLDIDSVKGSAQIACVSTSSVGTTCSGSDETNGITIEVPEATDYEVCSAGETNTQSNSLFALRIAKTAETSGTVLIDGKQARAYNDDGAADTTISEYNLCETLPLSVGRHTLRVLSNRSGSAGAAAIVARQSGVSSGISYRGFIKWTVRKKNFNVPAPILVGAQATSPNVPQGEKHCVLSAGGAGSLASPTSCTSSPCTAYADTCLATTGNWTRTAAGDYQITSTGWTPNTIITCNSASTSGGDAFAVVPFVTDGSGNVLIRSRLGTTTQVDSTLIMDCWGQR